MEESFAASCTTQEACARVVHLLYDALDRHDYTHLAAIFSADARMHRLGQSNDGLDAIRDAFEKRAVSLVTRHMVSNLLVTETAHGRATGSFYMMVVRAHAELGTPRPIPVASPWRLSQVQVAFAREPQGWRIASLATESQFEFSPRLAMAEATA
jgi:hypothetical protein